MFFLLGIAVLLLLTIYYIVNKTESDISGEEPEAVSLETKKDPVYQYVSQCLSITALDAFKQIGEHGGFVDLARHDFLISTDATNAEAVVMSNLGSNTAAEKQYAVPYYWHMRSYNGCSEDCSFMFMMPALYKQQDRPSIEEELEYYIDNNLKICINDFEELKRQGYQITSLGDPKSDIEILEEEVINTLKYPILIKQQDNTYTLDIFYTKHDINLKEIFKLAYEITKAEAEYRFLENMALNIISGYAAVNGEIPPIADSTFEFGSPGNVWVKSKVENNVKDAVAKYTNALRAVGTNNYVEIGEDKLDQKIMDYFMRITLNDTYDLSVSFNYLKWWPMYFDLNCDGEICKPESFSNTFMILIGNQRYKFFYSLAYPVLVKIHDSKAFKGRGFDYYFFLESNIRFNEPLPPGDSPYTGVTVAGTSLLCSEIHRNSGNFTFTVFDAKDEKPVEDVGLYYSCGYESCTIKTLENGYFDGKLPICAGGVITLMKEDYMQKSIFATTLLDVGEDLGDIPLEPLRKRRLSINKIKFKKLGAEGEWSKIGEGPLSENQEATIIITKDRMPGETKFMQVASVTDEEPEADISIVPGNYTVDVILLDKSKIVIPEEEKSITVVLVKKTFTIPGIEFNETAPFLAGGLKGNFTITGQIDDSDKLILNIISFELGEIPKEDRRITDLEVMGEVGNYSRKYKSILGFKYE